MSTNSNPTLYCWVKVVAHAIGAAATSDTGDLDPLGRTPPRTKIFIPDAMTAEAGGYQGGYLLFNAAYETPNKEVGFVVSAAFATEVEARAWIASSDGFAWILNAKNWMLVGYQAATTTP